MSIETIYQIIYAVLADEATDKEHHIFTEWLNASEANRKEYTKLKRLYQVTSHTVKEKTFDTDSAWLKVSQHTINKKKAFHFPIWTRYAAMITVIISISLFFFPRSPQIAIVSEIKMEEFDEPTLLLGDGEKIALTEESFSRQDQQVVIKNDARNKLTYETYQSKTKEITIKNNLLIIPKGKTYQLQLSDGTRIWLNSETELTYPSQFIGNKREVSLIGEAFFKVAKNDSKPFIVKVNGADIKVLGTSFNVSCYTNDKTISTTLVEGSVAVKPEKEKQQTIIPSEQLTYNTENHQTTIQTVNTEIFTSWINGRYIFKNTTLEEIMEKLQRWYDFSVNYEDENLKNNSYSLIAERNTELDKILEIISYTSDIKLERVNNSINIKKRKEEKL